jgi:uncharacterized Zn finger protein (UPF0148 family)
MLNYFCPKCGGKNLYQFQKPKFCSHCGTDFYSASATIKGNIKSNQFEVNINTSKPNADNYQESEDSDLIYDYKSMHGLDVDIQKYNQNDGVKLGDLVSDEPTQKINKKTIRQKRGRKKIAKSLPQSFVSEAKMSGRNYQSHEDINIIDSEE